MLEPLYIYVPNWEEHQPRADRPNLPWLRLHTKLLGSPAWLNLSCPDRVLLISVWMLIQRYGNGALLADEQWIKGQAKAHKSSLERLVQAGFLTLSTTKAEPNGGLEERREGKRQALPLLREEENARAAHAKNGGARAQKKEQPAHMRPFNPINNPGGYTKREGPPPGLKAHEEFKADGLPNIHQKLPRP